MTPDELRAQGYQVKFRHLRRWVPAEPAVLLATVGDVRGGYIPIDDLTPRWVLSPTGGTTVCMIIKNNETIAAGETLVNPIDTYNKRAGRVKSFGRAWADFQKKLPDEVSVVH